MVFQDPFASLNPRQTIGDILGAPLDVHRVGSRGERRQRVGSRGERRQRVGSRGERRQRVGEILSQVGLPEDSASRYAHEFSGGQRQRIGIARALILGPDLIICDEPVSALDLSVQAQVLNLLADIKRRLKLSLLFISHDLSVVRYLSDRVLVMYLGRIVESGNHEQILKDPLHSYTRALIDAVPDPARRRYAAPLPGDLPDPRNAAKGCRFQPRCPLATELCAQQDPELRDSSSGQRVACHHAGLVAN